MKPRIAIIGSGFSGLCLGIQLRQAGFDSFTILEKEDRLGGTWRDNSYPGAACDVPAMAYCFSFEQKSDWSRVWAPQDEILAYMEHCARKYGVLPRIRFGCEVEGARFDAERGVWHVRTTRGEEIEAEVLVSGVGQLNRPHVPGIPGLADFEGRSFHSARWDHGYDLAGKDVAVIGNAASAVQFIPQIAPRVRNLYVFQRSANWMLPRGDRPYTEREKKRFARFPWLARLSRWWIWLLLELRFPLFVGNGWLGRRIERMATQHVRDTVADPGLQRALIPDYPIGGKRILIADDYYQALQLPHVHLVLDPIERVTRDAVVTRDGTARRVDAIVLGTGFETTAFLAPMKIEGLDGRFLEDAWRDEPRAYLGMSVPGYPNFFMMYGPNTNLGHNSIIFMIECQARYIVDCVRQLAAGGWKWIDVRRAVADAFDRRTQDRLARTVWARTDRSWYKTKAGRITNNWSGTTTAYWWKTRRADLGAYHRQPGR
jgi:cation diffusion facilitator CzcD-associated flavoprotein CzcO